MNEVRFPTTHVPWRTLFLISSSPSFLTSSALLLASSCLLMLSPCTQVECEEYVILDCSEYCLPRVSSNYVADELQLNTDYVIMTSTTPPGRSA
eukprot:468534-Amphidinium_carterae.1